MFATQARRIQEKEKDYNKDNLPLLVKDQIVKNEVREPKKVVLATLVALQSSQMSSTLPSSPPIYYINYINYFSSTLDLLSLLQVRIPIYSSPVLVLNNFKYPNDALDTYFKQLEKGIRVEDQKRDYRNAYNLINVVRLTLEDLANPNNFNIIQLINRGMPPSIVKQVKRKVKEQKKVVQVEGIIGKDYLEGAFELVFPNTEGGRRLFKLISTIIRGNSLVSEAELQPS